MRGGEREGSRREGLRGRGGGEGGGISVRSLLVLFGCLCMFHVCNTRKEKGDEPRPIHQSITLEINITNSAF